MDKHLHDIEDLFRSGLDDNEEMPSAKVWDGVDSRLDKETVTSIKKKYNKLKRLSLLLLLLLIGLSIYELNIRRTNTGLAKTNAIAENKETISNNNNAVPGSHARVSDEKTNLKNINAPAQAVNNRVTIKLKNSPNTTKQKQKNATADENVFENNSSLFWVFPSSIKKNKQQKAITYGPVTDDRVLIVKNSSVADDEQFSIRRHQSFLSPEKINRPALDLIGTKKSWESSAISKNTPSLSVTASQQQKKKSAKSSRFSISVFFSPDIASYRLEDEDVVNQADNSAQIKKMERHEFSSTSAVMVDYKLNNKWTLQTGLSFANTNIAIEPKTIYAQTDNVGDVKYRLNFSSGYGYIVPAFQPSPAVGDSVRVTAAAHKLRYIGVPLAVKYRITNGKLSVEAMAGVSANFLTMGKLETEIQKGVNNEIDILNNIEGLKKIYLSGLAGIGAEYKLTGKVSFVLMPTARFALNPINKNAVVKTFPNSVGLSAGIKIKL